jgi:hypothetical protein
MGEKGWVPYDDRIRNDWDRFVLAHPLGRFIHLSGFKKTVQEVYKLRPNYWVYLRDDGVQAVFPSFFHRSILYARRLVSQPFSEYGGLLFAPSLPGAEKREILAGFPETAERSRESGAFDYLELRCFPDHAGLMTDIFQEERLYDYGLLPLTKGLNLWDTVEYSVRKNIRQARNHHLQIKTADGEEDIKKIFYPLHLRSLRRLGSPPHPLAYFMALHRNLGGHLRILAAFSDGFPVAALLGWEVGTSVHITDIVSDEAFYHLRAVDLLHYEFISRAIAGGFTCFDFGPLRYPGQRQYKLKWGIEVHGYSYFFYPVGSARKPLAELSPAARAGAAVWRRLPLRVAASTGKYLRKMLSI